MGAEDTSRRRFLQASGSTLGVAWVALHWPQVVEAAAHAHEAATGSVDHTFKLLTASQARDVEAIASQIVPGGATPGAREAGVVYFVDHVHAGVYERNAAAFLAGLTAFHEDFARRHPGVGRFADADPSTQIAYLKAVEGTPFFGQMRFLTVLGLLSLPSYGGNGNKVGWKIVGFVDRHVWEPPFGHYDADYPGFEPYAKQRQS